MKVSCTRVALTNEFLRSILANLRERSEHFAGSPANAFTTIEEIFPDVPADAPSGLRGEV